MSLLSLLLWTPIAGALVVAASGARERQVAHGLALVVSLLTLLLAVTVALRFDPAQSGIQLAISHAWAPSSGLSYALGIDGLSLPLVLLAAGMMVPALLAGERVEERPHSFYAWMLMLEGATLGVFLAQDWALFTMFWEFTLIPIFFLVGEWGGPRRHPAALTFLLYTMAGSAFLLTSLLSAYVLLPTHSFAMGGFAASARALPALAQGLIFAGFAIGFLVKMPAVPFHGWLVPAYVQSATPVTAFVAAVLGKMGAYGLLRASAAFPAGAAALSPVLATLGAAGVLLGALLAWRQQALKPMIAWSSLSHVGFILVGIAAGNPAGLTGAVLQMVAHGVIVGALFLLVGAWSHRTGAEEVPTHGALFAEAPVLGGLFALALFASAGLPGFGGFAAEVHIFRGGWERWGLLVGLLPVGGLLWALTAVRVAGRLLRGAGTTRPLPDLAPLERVAIVPLLGLLVWLGWRADAVAGWGQDAIRRIASALAGAGEV